MFIWRLGGESKAPDKIITFVLLNLCFGATKQSQKIYITQLTVKGQIRGCRGNKLWNEFVLANKWRIPVTHTARKCDF